jgi:diguanylate cyclase (GGDEF)-like protein
MSEESVSEGESVKKAQGKLGGEGDRDSEQVAGPPEDPLIPPTTTTDSSGSARSVESMLQELSSGGAAESTAGGGAGALRRSKFDLWQLSMADPHTGLANQLLLLDRLTQALARRRRHGGEVAVCHINLDNLAEIEADHGFMTSKDVLSDTARRLTSVLRAEDTVGRTGGSEFVVMAAVNDEQAVGPLMRRLQHTLDEPVLVGSTSIRLQASLGVAIAEDDESAEDVLARADRSTRVTRR